MIETEGKANPTGKSIAECPSKLRFNVPDIEQAHKRVTNFGISAEIIRNSWGMTINIHDPDGNRIGIRDEATFMEQLKSWKEH